MIRCNLSVLLAQRSLSITQVAKDTGISRTTLNALEKNYSQGVQLSTINTLCSYLHVMPSDLFKYYPIDIEWNYSFTQNDWSDGAITIAKNGKRQTFSIGFNTYIDSKFDGDECPRKCIHAALYVELFQEKPEDTQYIASVFDSLPVEFRSDIESFLLSRFEEFLYDEDLLITDDTQIDIEFEFEENT